MRLLTKTSSIVLLAILLAVGSVALVAQPAYAANRTPTIKIVDDATGDPVDGVSLILKAYKLTSLLNAPITGDEKVDGDIAIPGETDANGQLQLNSTALGVKEVLTYTYYRLELQDEDYEYTPGRIVFYNGAYIVKDSVDEKVYGANGQPESIVLRVTSTASAEPSPTVPIKVVDTTTGNPVEGVVPVFKAYLVEDDSADEASDFMDDYYTTDENGETVIDLEEEWDKFWPNHTVQGEGIPTYYMLGIDSDEYNYDPIKVEFIMENWNLLLAKVKNKDYNGKPIVLNVTPKPIVFDSIPVEYDDGSPVEDGRILTFSATGTAAKNYTVQDGAITDVTLTPNLQHSFNFGIYVDEEAYYYRGFRDAANQNYGQYLYVSVKPASAYEGDPVMYKYLTASKEITNQVIDKIVLVKIDKTEKNVTISPINYNNGTQVESGRVFSLTDADGNVIDCNTSAGRRSTSISASLLPYEKYTLTISESDANSTNTHLIDADNNTIESYSLGAAFTGTAYPWNEETNSLGKTNISNSGGIKIREVVTVEAVPATCEEDGVIEYYKDERTNKLYRDIQATEEITEDDLVDPAKGHKWDEGEVIKEATAFEDGEMKYTCLHDAAHTKTEVIPKILPSLEVVYEDGSPVEDGHEFNIILAGTPDEQLCTVKDGKISNLIMNPDEEYRISIDWSDDLYWYYYIDGTKRPGELLKIGVSAEDPATVMLWEGGSVSTTPARIVVKLMPVTIGSIPVEYEDGTPVEDGFSFELSPSMAKYTVESGKLSKVVFAPGVENRLAISSDNTSFDHVYFKDATDEKPTTPLLLGTKFFEDDFPTAKFYAWDSENNKIGAEMKKLILAKHTIVKHDAVAATCDTPGNIEYYECETCGKLYADEAGTEEITKASTVIAALGHKWDSGKVTKEPTTTATGVKTYTCTVCGKTKTEVIPKKAAPVTTKTTLKSATAPAQKYTGKALKPTVTVKDAKGKVVPASAYTVTYANNKYPGTATATVKAKGNSKYTGTVKATFKITAAEQGVYWLVNKKTGENLYTTAVKEVNTLSKVKKTWTNKGLMWYAPTVGDPIYRLVNKKTGDHHFTKSANEVRVLTKVKKTWTADFNGKPIFYSGGPKKVWRQYSDARQKAGKPGTHKFTTYNAKLKGWKNEGALIEALRYGKVNGVK